MVKKKIPSDTSSKVHSQQAEDGSSTSSKTPLIIGGVLLSMLLLFGRIASSRSKPKPHTGGGDGKGPNLAAIWTSMNNASDIDLFLSTRRAMNASSSHGLDLLLSLSTYPLLTSTVRQVLLGVAAGALNTIEDIRLALYVNLYTRVCLDCSVAPFFGGTMIGHSANFLTNTNAGQSVNYKDLVQNYPAYPYVKTANSDIFWARYCEFVDVGKNGPIWQVPAVHRVDRILDPSPHDTLNKPHDNSVDPIRWFPDLNYKSQIPIASTGSATSFIDTMRRNTEGGYSSAFFLNMAHPSGWLDDEDFYLRMESIMISINEDSALNTIRPENFNPSNQNELISALVNGNTVMPIPCSDFQQIETYFAELRRPNLAALTTMVDVDGTIFGHRIKLNDNTQVETSLTLVQLCFKLCDALVFRSIAHSINSQNGFIGDGKLHLMNAPSIDSTQWAHPLFVVQTDTIDTRDPIYVGNPRM